MRFLSFLAFFFLLSGSTALAQELPKWEPDATMGDDDKKSISGQIADLTQLKATCERELTTLQLRVKNLDRAASSWEKAPLKWTGDEEEDHTTGFTLWIRQRSLQGMDRDFKRIDRLQELLIEWLPALNEALKKAHEHKWENTHAVLVAWKKIVGELVTQLQGCYGELTKTREALEVVCKVSGVRPNPFRDAEWVAPEGFPKELQDEISALRADLIKLHSDVTFALDVYGLEYEQTRKSMASFTPTVRRGVIKKITDEREQLVVRAALAVKLMENIRTAMARAELSPAKELLEKFLQNCGVVGEKALALAATGTKLIDELQK
jgi:hypothetical protein